jgi:hypothetical protein
VPETALSDELLARLPENLAPAPWDARFSGLVWAGRGGSAARAALPSGLRDSPALATVGGFVRYEDTPVGRYDEVFGQVASREGLKSWGSVTFMAVDSEASLVGGRSNWSMPKTLARFEGEIGPKKTIAGWSDGPVRWRVQATPVVVGPRVPLGTSAQVRQQFPDGVVRPSVMVGKGAMRPALIRVEVVSDGPLAGWLRPGLHAGALIESGAFSLSDPRA